MAIVQKNITAICIFEFLHIFNTRINRSAVPDGGGGGGQYMTNILFVVNNEFINYSFLTCLQKAFLIRIKMNI